MNHTLDRRTMLKMLAGGAGSLMLAPYAWPVGTPVIGSAGPRRFVFFLQNHGFNPLHATPEGVMKGIVINTGGYGASSKLDKLEDLPLASMKLPAFIDPLEPYKDRLTIVQGLNGRHVSPNHGALYGALGGFRRSPSSTPTSETIDCALSRTAPGILPLVVLGWETLDSMKNSPIHYASSAWGANKAVPMICDPLLAYKSVFGAARPGKERQDFEAETESYHIIKLNRHLSFPCSV